MQSQLSQLLQPQLQPQELQLLQPQELQPQVQSQLSQLLHPQLHPQLLQELHPQLLQPQELQPLQVVSAPLTAVGAAGQGPVKKGKLRGRHRVLSAPTDVVERVFPQPLQLRQESQLAKRMSPFLGIRFIL